MNSLLPQPDNPFASRYVRPGAIAYQFPDGQSAPQLIGRLQASGWRGQIVGPHGSGKSSLVATLIPWLKRAGRQPIVYELHDGQRRLATGDRAQTTQVIVDGYEQLSPLSRWRLQYSVRRSHCGLLVTVHAPIRLPELVRIEPTLQTVLDLVDQLLGGAHLLVSRDDVAASFARHHGNVREILFDLYDLYERIRR
jgi:hypothetical protein